MLTKFNDSNDMNTVASDAIHSYIKDGYRIDAKESVIDREKDKDCTFKAVLKKDVDGIECKTVITLSDNGDDKNKHCTYHKVETVGDTKWSEETRTFSSSCCGADKNTFEPKAWRDSLQWLDDHRKRMRSISDKYNFGWDWFDRNWSNRFKRLSDVIKAPDDTHDSCDDNSDKANTKWKCKCPSAYTKLDDYIKLDTPTDKSDNGHIKVNAKDTESDIYNKIVDKYSKDTKKKVPIESLINKKDADKTIDDVIDKVKANAANSKLESRDNDDDDADDLEDSLIKLVRYIFGK